MNPYESPQTGDSVSKPFRVSIAAKNATVIVIVTVLTVVVLAGFASFLVSSLRAILWPRVPGWLFCVQAITFPSMWLYYKRNAHLRAAALMFVMAGLGMALLLWRSGTVAEVAKAEDALHSAWYWSVAPMFVLAALMLVLGLVPDEAPAESRRQKWEERFAHRKH